MFDVQPPVKIFLSYAPEDEVLCLALEKHLGLLVREGLITIWHKRKLVAGIDWSKEIDQHLSTASVVLLLLSVDFVASDYCYGVEMQHAMERHEADEACVIPVVLRSMDDWQNAPFGKLTALPSNGLPVTQWRDRHDAFADIARGIRVALKEVERLAVSTPLTTFPRIWNIPYSRNPTFTGRENILTQLTDVLKIGHATTSSQPQAISGLGGVGKTQIAIEYAYRHHQDYQAVLWTLADTHGALVSGYVAIASLLNLPEKDEEDQSIAVKAVLRWLTSHTEWLLILDNADELAVVREFIPSVFGGHILLTTRAQATGKMANRIEVESMSQDVGALFLLRRAKLLAFDALLEDAAANVVTAREICVELGGLPLALDQAGAYIEETPCNLLDYQQLYRTRRVFLLKRRGSFADDYPESVATTWSISFEKVEQRCPEARDLLHLCAFLSPDAIPEEIITKGATHLGTLLQSVANDALRLNEAISILSAYSLVRRDSVARSLSLHRLVQAVVRDALSAKKGKQWMLRAISAVDATFPSVKEFDQWAACERWLPHAFVCSIWIEQKPMIFPKAAPLLKKMAYYLDQRGQYSKAEPLFKLELSINERKLGPTHPDTATSLHNLANLYHEQGKYEQAESLYKRALSINEQEFGPTHSEVAAGLNNLAVLYKEQGKYEQAESLYERVLLICKQEFGPTHPNTVSSLNNLAALYSGQGKYEQAESLLAWALSSSEQVLGLTHPDTALGLNNLATLYYEQGKYEQAEPLFERALLIWEQGLGPMHPHMASNLNNLAGLYLAQGKYEQAEPLYKRALSINEQVLGPAHPNTALNLNGLAVLYKRQGRYEQAEPLYKRALLIREQTLGSTHPETANSLNNLAALYNAQGKYKQAESLYKQALAIREQRLGPTHPDTATSLNNLASLYQAQGKYKQAEPLYIRAISICKQELGPTHPNTGLGLNNLAGLYQAQGKYSEAIPLYELAISICEQGLGPEHPRTQVVRENYMALLDSMV